MAVCEHADVCDRDASEDQDGRCILHSEDSGKDPQAFMEALKEHWAEHGPNFERMVFPVGVSFRRNKFEGEANFDHTTFKGESGFFAVTFKSGANFRHARFEGEVKFGNATFAGEANFENATFDHATSGYEDDSKYVKFRRDGESGFFAATFKSGANFRYVGFAGEANFGNATFAGEANFGNATFAGEARFGKATFESDAFFWDATFKGRTRFGHAIFEGNARFGRYRFEPNAGPVTFEDNTSFFATTFEGEASLWHATFEGKASFNNAIFEGWTDFRRTTFEGKTSFRNTTFEGKAKFGNATFEGKAKFRNATFEGKTSFRNAIFESEVAFKSTTFKNKANFYVATFEDKALFSGASETECIFAEGEVVFTDVIFAQDTSLQSQPPLQFRYADLSRCRFVRTDLRNIDFTGVQWCEKVSDKEWFNRVGLYDEVYQEEDTNEETKNARPWPEIERLYRQLKKNYEDRGDFPRAGDFHMGEKEARRRSATGGLYVLLTTYRSISKYGRRALPALFWLAAVIAICAAGYYLLGVPPANSHGALSGVQALLFSFEASLLPFRPGNLEGELAYALNMLQRLVSPFLLTLSALALRQRMKR